MKAPWVSAQDGPSHAPNRCSNRPGTWLTRRGPGSTCCYVMESGAVLRQDRHVPDPIRHPSADRNRRRHGDGCPFTRYPMHPHCSAQHDGFTYTTPERGMGVHGIIINWLPTMVHVHVRDHTSCPPSLGTMMPRTRAAGGRGPGAGGLCHPARRPLSSRGPLAAAAAAAAGKSGWILESGATRARCRRRRVRREEAAPA